MIFCQLFPVCFSTEKSRKNNDKETIIILKQFLEKNMYFILPNKILVLNENASFNFQQKNAILSFYKKATF